ncbi:MAG TPA: cell division protein ZipA C-terminal FtsZ-binding domain-containing protein [Burkholderiales bacterium]|nr:cell division protein ZipA C-terminal FtsZ-binding domain-containing protein [Burkholderiales bacterium]
MSDLQIGLAILGAFVIAGVALFNWWQERKFRRSAQQDFPRPQHDVLLGTGAADTGRSHDTEARIEPQLDPLSAVGASGPAPSPPPRPLAPAAQPDAAIDHVAELHADQPISAAEISLFAAALSQALGRPILAGYNPHAKTWEPFAGVERGFASLRAGLQLADRNGPATREQLRAFHALVRQHAERMAADVQVPDVEEGMRRAQELHRFFEEVDVVVGINIIAHSGQVFHGTQVRALAEAQGMRLQPGGAFASYGENEAPLFTLENQEPRPFKPEDIRHITTSAVTFLLDVPRTRDGLKVFDRMVVLSRQFAESLDGLLADDNRQLLNESGLDKIRARLRTIYAAMEARGIPAGSASAMRLFA